jgi:hypothetical protein
MEVGVVPATVRSRARPVAPRPLPLRVTLTVWAVTIVAGRGREELGGTRDHGGGV